MALRALDLFCGAGGASAGLARAGFDVVGIDIRPMPRYPFTFIQADALKPPAPLSDFDFIWASPPCQAFSVSKHFKAGRPVDHPDLIAPVRALLAASGCRFTAIENVKAAPIRRDLVLDGTMFPPLKVIRRRAFELSFFCLGPDSRVRSGLVSYHGWSSVVGGGRCSGLPKTANAWHTADACRAAMGIDWMTRRELSQAIPPQYAEFIGRAARAQLELGRAA